MAGARVRRDRPVPGSRHAGAGEARRGRGLGCAARHRWQRDAARMARGAGDRGPGRPGAARMAAVARSATARARGAGRRARLHRADARAGARRSRPPRARDPRRVPRRAVARPVLGRRDRRRGRADRADLRAGAVLPHTSPPTPRSPGRRRRCSRCAASCVRASTRRAAKLVPARYPGRHVPKHQDPSPSRRARHRGGGARRRAAVRAQGERLPRAVEEEPRGLRRRRGPDRRRVATTCWTPWRPPLELESRVGERRCVGAPIRWTACCRWIRRREDMRAMGEAAVAYLIDFIAGLDDAPAEATEGAVALARAAARRLPGDGRRLRRRCSARCRRRSRTRSSTPAPATSPTSPAAASTRRRSPTSSRRA